VEVAVTIPVDLIIGLTEQAVKAIFFAVPLVLYV
jgi:hypothetical protein